MTASVPASPGLVAQPQPSPVEVSCAAPVLSPPVSPAGPVVGAGPPVVGSPPGVPVVPGASLVAGVPVVASPVVVSPVLVLVVVASPVSSRPPVVASPLLSPPVLPSPVGVGGSYTLPASTRVTTKRTSVGMYSAAVFGPTLSAEGLPFIVSLRMHAILLVPRVQSTMSPW